MPGNTCLAYGAKVQYVMEPNHTIALDAASCKCVQEVIGVLLYYAHTVNPVILIALGTQQEKGAQATMEALMHLLNYCATHPNTVFCFHGHVVVANIH